MAAWEDVTRALGARPPAVLTDTVSSRAAVAVVLRDGPSGIEALFIRRAEHPEDPWSGQMGFPGGRSEEGDADLRRTAVRETQEEIGLDLDAQADFMGSLDEVRAMARMRAVDLSISPFVFRLHRDFEAVLNEEIRSIHWLPLDALMSPALRSTMAYLHKGVALRFPCVRVEDVVIWGLTYRMLLGLFERLGVTPPADAVLGPQPLPRAEA